MALFHQVKGRLSESHGISKKISLLYGTLSSADWESLGRVNQGASLPLRWLGATIRLCRAAERWVDATAEGTIVALILAGFVVLWMIFWAVTTAPLDVAL